MQLPHHANHHFYNAAVKHFLLIIVLLSGSIVFAQEEPKSHPQGLALHFESDNKKDVRDGRLIALRVPAKTSPTPFLEPGPFRATWRGFLKLDIRSRLYFSVSGVGRVKFTIGEDTVFEGDIKDLKESDRLRIGKGENPIVFEYTAPRAGDAWVRLYWRGRDFGREPIPPSAFTHEAETDELVHSDEMRLGRHLFATKHCARCHKADDPTTLGKLAMPELSSDAPSLENIGARLNADWIAHWVANPRRMRPTATMPNTFGHLDAARALKKNDHRPWQIASFLASIGGDAPQPPTVELNPKMVSAGGELFASLGCIGCHTRPDVDDIYDVHSRIPLKYASWKFKQGALQAFLKNPQQHYKWNRMPNFGFSDDEAAKLAAYIRSSSTADDSAVRGKPDPVKGKELVQTLGCLSCHALKLENKYQISSLESMFRADWEKSCCVTQHDSSLFDLDETECSSLQTFGKHGLPSLKRRTLSEFATRQISELNCKVCHTRDDLEDRWSSAEKEVSHLLPEKDEDIFEEDQPEVDQSRPSLTWVGEKLHVNWMSEFIGGKVKYKPRPWLHARMPTFAARADLLAQGLALEHGLAVGGTEMKPNDELKKIGRQLVGPANAGGFACNACHSISNTKAVAVFEVEGLNFMYAKERLRREFFMRWLLDPQRITPMTKMPKYADDEGFTPFAEILGGDANKQFDAIWHYLQTGQKIEAPS